MPLAPQETSPLGCFQPTALTPSGRVQLSAGEVELRYTEGVKLRALAAKHIGSCKEKTEEGTLALTSHRIVWLDHGSGAPVRGLCAALCDVQDAELRHRLFGQRVDIILTINTSGPHLVCHGGAYLRGNKRRGQGGRGGASCGHTGWCLGSAWPGAGLPETD